MSPQQATAQIFLTAFKAMSFKEQSSILRAFVNDASLREDIIDMAIAVKRIREKSKPLRAFLKSINKLPSK